MFKLNDNNIGLVYSSRDIECENQFIMGQCVLLSQLMDTTALAAHGRILSDECYRFRGAGYPNKQDKMGSIILDTHASHITCGGFSHVWTLFTRDTTSKHT